MKESVGKRLYECRKALNLTQKDVAEMLGVAQPVYQRFEAGFYECNYEQLVRLSEFLTLPLIIYSVKLIFKLFT